MASLDVDQIIAEVYERCGLNPEQIGDYEVDSAIRTINLVFADWEARKTPLFTLKEFTLTTTAGQASYILDDTYASNIIDIKSISRENGGSWVPLDQVNNDDWNSLPNRGPDATNGTPFTYYLDLQRIPVLWLWYTPSSDMNLQIWAQTAIESVEDMVSEPNISPRYIEALVACAAAKYAQKKAIDRVPMLTTIAQDAMQAAFRSDDTDSPIIMEAGGWSI